MVDFAGENAFLDELSAFLCRPDIEQLFLVHPNQAVVVGFTPPMAWANWWEWAGEESQFEDTKWEFLWKYYTTPEAYTKQEMFQSIPAGLRALIDDARRLQLTRVIGTDASIPQGALSTVSQEANAPNIPIPEDVPYSTLSGSQKMRGMSPKKAHEVRRMADYTSRLLSSMYSRGISIRHAVDVGAGQVRIPCSPCLVWCGIFLIIFISCGCNTVIRSI